MSYRFSYRLLFFSSLKATDRSKSTLQKRKGGILNGLLSLIGQDERARKKREQKQKVDSAIDQVEYLRRPLCQNFLRVNCVFIPLSISLLNISNHKSNYLSTYLPTYQQSIYEFIV